MTLYSYINSFMLYEPVFSISIRTGFSKYMMIDLIIYVTEILHLNLFL